MPSGFVIAAASSGSGKTTLALGLMRALVRRGAKVQPFKCGPDYIDTQFHSVATGRDSVNLDTFMSSDVHMGALFDRYASDADVAVIEGVMGMFDGYSKMAGSSADVASRLSLPVILLVNAASTAYSVAATIYGFRNFCPEVKIAGVVFNRVASTSHYSFLREACDDAGVECLGCLLRNDALAVPSRHLGLTLSARNDMDAFIESAANAVEATVDVERLLELTEMGTRKRTENFRTSRCKKGMVVAVARDEAFNFIYRANLDRLRIDGCKVVEFSPLHDTELPKADMVYLPGGYPELFAEELSANMSMLTSVRGYVLAGGRLWAECGGLIYLVEELDGRPMCGIFPLRCTMDGARLSLGYRTLDFGYAAFRGHEFHYSRIVNPEDVPSVAQQRNVRGADVPTPVYRCKNAFASYTHLYWADNNIFNLWI